MSDPVTDLINSGTQTIVNAVDANGNGVIDLEDFIIHGLKIPGVGVDRASFLKAEFQKYLDSEQIERMIQTTPARAEVNYKLVNKVARDVIEAERLSASGISAALGVFGGTAAVATIPADLVQYYGFMLRTAQKLMYLYGFPQINVQEKNQTFDSETINTLTLCLGVMCGVSGANKALKALAVMLGKGVEKKLLQTALTKTVFYKTVKKIAQFFATNVTKKTFASFFKNAIPVVGGLVSGGITYLCFGACCETLRNALKNTALSNPTIDPEKDLQDFLLESEQESELNVLTVAECSEPEK